MKLTTAYPVSSGASKPRRSLSQIANKLTTGVDSCIKVPAIINNKKRKNNEAIDRISF